MIKNKIVQLLDFPSLHPNDIVDTPFDWHVSIRLPAISYSSGYLCVTYKRHII